MPPLPKKKSLETEKKWIDTFPPNFVLIHLRFSEKAGSTDDDGRRTPAP